MEFLLVANWKMNGNKQIALEYRKKLENYLESHQVKSKIVVCPPFPYLDCLKSDHYQIGAQNVSSHLENGPFTGEVSAAMLKDIACNYVIIGHSEARCSENDTQLKEKFAAAIKNDLKIIYCVGETLEQRAAEKHLEATLEQIDRVVPRDIKKLNIAYEPIWSIGSGTAISINQLDEILEGILLHIDNNYPNLSRNSLRLIYGGSVTHENAAKFVALPKIKGLLIGSSSVECNRFINIVEVIC